MHAYNERELCNKYVHEQATEALRTACISQESYKNILQAQPSKLYTPNYFIRIAMGLLTVVSVLFSGLLLWLFTSASSDAAITTVLVFLAIICYIALELLVKVKQYFNAGVDNILMCMLIAFVVSAFFISDQDSLLIISCVIMIITLWLSIRFTDAFMSVVCYCCFFVFVFMAYIKAGEFAMATASLMMMAVSAIVYLLMKKLAGSTTFKYQFCFNAVTFFTLVTFYASGNYFIVKELSNQMFHLTPNNPLPFGWLFWIFTLIIPPAYIIYGIIKKGLLLVRTGLGLIGATIFTVKYYYTVLPTEIEMLIAGILLVGLSYALIKYLAISKHGYTSQNMYRRENEILNAEALIIAETFNKNPTKENQGLYGGGTGGGGGATGEY
jgi:hypothetical protein